MFDFVRLVRRKEGCLGVFANSRGRGKEVIFEMFEEG